MALLETNGIIFPMNKNTTSQQLNAINIRMEKIIDRMMKNNAENLKTLCEISTLLQNLEDGFYKTNDILLKDK